MAVVDEELGEADVETTTLLDPPVPRDDIKTHMSNERTFFKWLWSGLRLGSVGTFVLAFFDRGKDPFRLPLVAFCWIVAIGFMIYGLVQYESRRQAIFEGSVDRDRWQHPAGPVAITVAFTVVVLLVIFATLVERK
ncbi:hypothetical protein NDN08_006177 [Rhodosorus marinus]|uniref:DUF202 domain-containing protein n=1 Tax=Rhodosorus marinus TaxID=101924 RepID=A0AAV8UNX4_9RHOD|nr:hypothetical protein NDN08_006177 [Rhodosorus marinus]